MPDPKQPPGTPDLFTAALTFAGVNLMWVFFVIWMLYGLVPVLLLALLINHFIARLEARLGKPDHRRRS
ncbi:histidinol phosphate aminotransferase [Roseobacteraceae bacterium NS-SX3]